MEAEKELKRVKGELQKIMKGNLNNEMHQTTAKLFMRLLDKISHRGTDYEFYLMSLKNHSKGGD